MIESIIAGAFALISAGWSVAAYLARRDRARIQQDISELSHRIEQLVTALDGLRGEIQRMAIEHERRLVRLETIIDGR